MFKFPRTFLLLALAGIGTAAGNGAQPFYDGRESMCPDGQVCPDQEEMETTGGFIELLDSEEPFQTMERESTWMLGDPPQDWDMMFPSVAQEPSVAWLEWDRGRVVDDPTYSRTVGCARTPARARGRLVRALREGNENGLLSVYFWREKGEGSVAGILAQLQSLPTDGQWEGTRVGMWTGTVDVRDQVPTYWRWSDGVSHHHFLMREDTECWMIEFSEAPAESIEIMPDSAREGAGALTAEEDQTPPLSER